MTVTTTEPVSCRVHDRVHDSDVCDMGRSFARRDTVHHALTRMMPLIRRLAAHLVDLTGHALVVTDAESLVLWADESAGPLVGTYHPRSGVASPIHDLVTGRCVGVIDVGRGAAPGDRVVAGLVCFASRVVEGELHAAVAGSGEHRVRTAGPAAHIELLLLGERRPRAYVDDHEVVLSNKAAEILALLALHREGLTAQQLALRMYGESGRPGTIRVVMHRLQQVLGSCVVKATPYRLDGRLDADFLRVWRRLRDSDVPGAVNAYTGHFLPFSESPEIMEVRDTLHCSVRNAVVNSDGVDVLWRFADSQAGHDDFEVLEALVDRLPAHDPRRAVIGARLSRLLAEP